MMRFVLVWIRDELAVSRPDATNDRLANSYDVLLARLQRQYPQSTLDQRATAVLNAYRTMGIDNEHYVGVVSHGPAAGSRLVEMVRRALTNVAYESNDTSLDSCLQHPGWGTNWPTSVFWPVPAKIARDRGWNRTSIDQIRWTVAANWRSLRFGVSDVAEEPRRAAAGPCRPRRLPRVGRQ